MILGACSLGYVVYSSCKPLKPATGYLARPQRTFRRKPLFNASELSLYLSLDFTKDIIRLLVVNPGQGAEDIHCSLENVSLDRSPVYTALSYTWGSPIRRSASLWTYHGMRQYMRQLYERVLPRASTIFLEGRPVPVAPNLESALRHLRRHDMPLIIWVDAVCINQGNDQEKEHQVGLMHRIYAQAETTYVWLGDAADGSDKAIDFIAGCANLNVMDPMFQIHHIAPPSSALQALFARSWWSRVWVIQEVLLSKNIVVKCGHKEAPFDSFVRLAEKEHKLRARLRTDFTFDINYVFRARWTFLPPTVPFYLILYSWFSVRKGLAENLGIPLVEYMTSIRSFNATIRRDIIYGLLGISTHEDRAAITVDYSAQKSDSEVFKEVVVHYLKTRRNLNLLQSVQQHKTLDLPSWAPDLSHSDLQHFTFDDLNFTAGGNNATWILLDHPTLGSLVFAESLALRLICQLIPYAFSWLQRTIHESINASVILSNNDNTLTLRGIPFDIIAIADPAPKLQIIQASDVIYLEQDNRKISFYELVPVMLRWEKQVGSHSDNPYGTSEGRYNAFWRTLIANRYRSDISQGMIAPPADYHLAYEQWMGRCTAQRDPREFSYMKLLTGTFIAMVGRVVNDKAFVITKRGFLGMAPVTTKAGDLVCVFQGGCVPFVIRPKGEHGQWELIGACYVHGIMDGEVVAKAQPKDVNSFQLV